MSGILRGIVHFGQRHWRLRSPGRCMGWNLTRRICSSLADILTGCGRFEHFERNALVKGMRGIGEAVRFRNQELQFAC